MDEAKIPKGLRELYADCLADDSRAMRTTTSKFMAELIERIVRAEAQVAALKKQLQTANKELALWRSEHDPCPFALENERLTEQLQDADDRADTNLGELNRISQDNAWLREQLRVRSQPVSDEEWMDATGTTAVFENELMTREAADDLIAARSAAPGKEREDGK